MTPATKAPPRPRAARQGTAARTAAARRTAGRQTTRPHRRVSGPGRPAAGARAATARAVAVPLPAPPLGALGLRVLRAGRSLQDSTLLERLVRGRGWILVLGALLFGLVALNVSLLKLNAAAGHNAERAKVLRIQNAKLRGKVSRLASGDRLRASAAELGLVMPEPKKVHYLTTRPDRDPRQAVRNIRDGIALNLTDDLVSATPAVDSELVAPTPPQPLVESPAPAAQTTTDPATGAPVPAAAPAPGAGTTGAAGVTGQAAPTAPQQTPPAGG
jgi:hypothetical protein